MDAVESAYRKLNPFMNSSVGEKEIWGEENSDFYDVDSIHNQAFRDLLNDIEDVKRDHLTRCRFLVGASGTGKSHLFARLRRRLSDGQFTFVSNPPTDPWAIKRYVLKKVVAGMKRPVVANSGPLPYSQIQRVAYTLLRSIRRFPGLKTVDRIHRAWKERVPLKDYYPREQDLFVAALGKLTNIEIPGHVRRVLFKILDEEKRGLATDWLSGHQGLVSSDYEALGVSGPMEDHEITDVLKWLGALSVGAGPIVLALDQLDILGKAEQINEIESLLIDLRDGGLNWFAIISLLHEKVDLWNSALSDPFKGRFGASRAGGARLFISELSAITRDQAGDLLRARLNSPQLVARRKADGVDDGFYPLTEALIEDLASEADTVLGARQFLQKASDKYIEAISGLQPGKKLLADLLKAVFADIRDALSEDDLSVDTSLLADRIGELLDIILLNAAGSRPEKRIGPLHREMRNFRGSDRIYSHERGEIRVVGHDIQQGNSFPSVLDRIASDPPGTLLVRDGRIRASGARTRELLARFQQDKPFVHLPIEHIKNLHALGALLAKMREGDFEHEAADPAPVEENILGCLAEFGDLMDMSLSRELKSLVIPENDSGTGVAVEETSSIPVLAPEPALRPDPLPTAPVSDSVGQVVAEIMEKERWLAFERLCVRVTARAEGVDASQIYELLKQGSVSDRLIVFPTEGSTPLEAPAVVVWTEEA